MNIIISVNDKYVDKAETMLFSLRLAVKGTIEVFLLNHSLKDETVYEMVNVMSSSCHDLVINVIDIRKTALDQLTIGNLNFSIEMYYRIIAQFLLPSYLERALWLDADIIIMKDISGFYEQEFDGMKYVVCQDSRQDCQDVQNCKRNISLPENSIYFNSGVMLINLELLRKESNQQKIIETCYLLQDILTYPDQDILNYLYHEQVKIADWKTFNYQLTFVDSVPKSELDNIAILHYSGPNKPWNYWQINSVSRYWWKIRLKQGKRLETVKAYLLKIHDMNATYFQEIKRILF